VSLLDSLFEHKRLMYLPIISRVKNLLYIVCLTADLKYPKQAIYPNLSRKRVNFVQYQILLHNTWVENVQCNNIIYGKTRCAIVKVKVKLSVKRVSLRYIAEV